MHIIIKKVQVRLVSHTKITVETIYTPQIGRMPRVWALIGKAMRKQSHVLQARQRVGSPLITGSMLFMYAGYKDMFLACSIIHSVNCRGTR